MYKRQALCLPAPGQGILGLEIRDRDQTTEDLLASISCPIALTTSTAERSFLAALDGGCHIPAGAYAQIEAEVLNVTGFLATEKSDGSWQGQRMQVSGPIEDAAKLGREVALALKSQA